MWVVTSRQYEFFALASGGFLHEEMHVPVFSRYWPWVYFRCYKVYQSLLLIRKFYVRRCKYGKVTKKCNSNGASVAFSFAY